MEEIWRDVVMKNYENKYQCSNFGNIKLKNGNKILQQKDKKTGRHIVLRSTLNDKNWYFVSEIIMKTFVGNLPENHKIHYKDGNVYNCRLDNLEYVALKDKVEYNLTEEDIKNEVWKAIPLYNYECSNMGIFRNLTSKEYITPGLVNKTESNTEVFKVSVYKNGKKTRLNCAEIITNVFYGFMNNEQMIWYKDGDRSNLRLSNLIYINKPKPDKTPKEKHPNTTNKKAPVAKYDMNGKLLEVYESVTDAKLKNNVDRKSIYNVCNEKQKQSGGFIWKYHTSTSN
jgi:hypothetical protein